MKVLLSLWHDSRPDHALKWLELRRSNPALVSPYFHPKFTGIVDNARRVEVAVIEEANGIQAYLPFHRLPGNIGVPVGHYLSDYHGLICAPGYSLDPRDLLRQCSLIAWDFDHLIASQYCFSPFHKSTDISPQIDLSCGFEAYCREQKAVKSEQIKFRRLARDHGELRLVLHSADQGDLQQLLTWKSAQYRKSGQKDIFVQPWATSVVQDIHATQDKHFSGVLSILYAGDRLAAAHFGIKSGGVLHSWFPAYDPELATYSPGLILLLKIAEQARSLGVTTIDLGQGMYEWKRRFMNTSVPLAAGSIELPSLRYVKRGLRRGARSLAIRLNIHGAIRAIRKPRNQGYTTP